jgi:hypothetical protein
MNTIEFMILLIGTFLGVAIMGLIWMFVERKELKNFNKTFRTYDQLCICLHERALLTEQQLLNFIGIAERIWVNSYLSEDRLKWVLDRIDNCTPEELPGILKLGNGITLNKVTTTNDTFKKCLGIPDGVKLKHELGIGTILDEHGDEFKDHEEVIKKMELEIQVLRTKYLNRYGELPDD